MRILLIEDDEKVSSLVAHGLKEAGFVVDRAADGEEGLHLALTEPYDTAVVDLMLPKEAVSHAGRLPGSGFLGGIQAETSSLLR